MVLAKEGRVETNHNMTKNSGESVYVMAVGRKVTQSGHAQIKMVVVVRMMKSQPVQEPVAQSRSPNWKNK